MLSKWQKKDPVEIAAKALTKAARAEIDAAIEAEIAAAVRFAEESPFPPVEELYTDVFA
jgi:pyruvate dehydrogenase E1 component alpha subunit